VFHEGDICVDAATGELVQAQDEDALRAQIAKYRWYHCVRITDTLQTPSVEQGGRGYPEVWSLIRWGLDQIDFKGKRVLDVGCRDGMFSFEAENRGAAEVVGIDNELSRGAIEFLIPYLKSRVRMHEINLYDLAPERFGLFDVVIFPGVLYHLRYPFWGLKKIVDCIADGGVLLVESGMLADARLRDFELLYCPFETSPYEQTSPTFFNETGLVTTMRSLHCRLVVSRPLTESPDQDPPGFLPQLKRLIKEALEGPSTRPAQPRPLAIDRYVLIFGKDSQYAYNQFRDQYWNATHSFHAG
jgi:SAM-dependent methyltransferase